MFILQVSTIVPIVIILGVKAAEFLATCITKTRGKNKDQIERRQAQRNKGDKIALLVLLLVFPGIVNQAFSVFRCRTFAGVEGQFMEKDLSVKCYVGEHATYMILAGIAIAVYACGVPLLLFVILYTNRNHLHDHQSDTHALVFDRLGQFYWHFEEDWYFWEVLVLCFKLLLTGLMCVVAHGSPYQTLLAFLISSIYSMLLLRESPYYADSADRLAISAGMSLSLTLLGGFVAVLSSVASEDSAKIDPDSLDIVLLVINIVPIGVFVGNVIASSLTKVVGTSRRHRGQRKSFVVRKKKNNGDGGSGSGEKTKVTPAGIKNWNWEIENE